MIITDIDKLRKPCKSVSFTDDVNLIVERLKEELELNKSGIGLSANQIGIDARICLARYSGEQIALVNPRIIERDDLVEFYNEGCLSFPGKNITTKRYNDIVVQDDNYKTGICFYGIESVIIQHEIDHLEGKIMFDSEIIIPGVNEKCWCGSGNKYKRCHKGKVIG